MKEDRREAADRRGRRTRYMAVFLLLVCALCALLALNVCTGSVRIPADRLLRILTTGAGERNEVNIIWRIRLPRVLTAAILGGALALSGYLLQTFFENPIAGPFVLGISSGAKLTVALTMIVLLKRCGSVSSWTLILAAFAGAMGVTGLILLAARQVRHMASLLVAGIMIGYICSAATDFLITFADDSDIANLHGWSLGSFSGMNWSSAATAGGVVGVAAAAVFLMSKPIGAFRLGEAYARSVGVNIRRFRIALILLSSVLSACVTAFAGPISFVGIAVPFLARQSLKSSEPLAVIPATMLGGAVFCAGCDLIARTAFAPTELNISTVTSIFGAPVVLYMLMKRRGNERE